MIRHDYGASEQPGAVGSYIYYAISKYCFMKPTTLLILLAFLAAGFGCTSPLALNLGRKVQPGLFGVNAGTSFYWCNPTNIDTCIQEYKALSPAIIRFPSGLDANYYHMDGPGYGFRQPPEGSPQQRGGGSEDEQRSRGSDSGSSDDEAPSPRFAGGNGSLHFVDPRDAAHPGGKNVIGEFIQLAVASGSKLLFTCNMLDASYEENKQVLDSLLRGGVQLAGIELGNEFYLPRYRYKYASVQDYLDTAKYYTARLRQDFPDVKIGAVASPSEIMPAHEGQTAYYKSWNEALAAENFYDAYIVHYYIKDSPAWCPGDTLLHASLPATYARYHDSLQKHLGFWFGPALEGFKALFPRKKMWITEWNTTNRYRCFGNTQVNNLFFAQYQNELATHYSDLVELAVHHNWLGRGIHFPMLAPAGAGFEERSSWPLFKLLQPIFSDQGTRTVELPGNVTGYLPPGLRLYSYHQPAKGKHPARLLIVVVNLNPHAQIVSLAAPSVKIGHHTFDIQRGVVRSVFAEKLWASLGKPGFFSDLPVAPEAIQTAESAFNGQLTAPGYGVSVVELK
jgi:hypothetical protein